MVRLKKKLKQDYVDGSSIDTRNARIDGNGNGMESSEGEGEEEDQFSQNSHESSSDVGDLDNIEEESQKETQNDTKAPFQPPKQLPTAQELRAIFEASELYKSNAFKLQMENLLPSIAPKTSKTLRGPLDAFLLRLHDQLLHSTKKSVVPKAAQHPLEVAEALGSHGIRTPFPTPPPTKDAKWTFKYEPPTSMTLIGSWANNTSVKHKDDIPFSVDLAVGVPQDLLQERDYLNDRYFHKRALYLACIASILSPLLKVEMWYDSPMNDLRQTILVISPPDDALPNRSKLNVVVRIVPSLPSDSPIPLSRSSPSSSNLRLATQLDSQSSTISKATPHYNNLLAKSMTPTSDLLALHNFSSTIPNFIPAVQLLRVWANQRGFGRGQRSCVRGFELLGMWWGYVIAMLAEGDFHPPSTGNSSAPLKRKPKSKRRALGKGLSSYQLFRGALDFLAHHDFRDEPIFMKGVHESHKFDPEPWISTRTPVFLDPSLTVNLLESIPYGSLDLLRIEAGLTLQSLETASTDTFTSTFLRDLRISQARFDVVLRVNLTGAKARREDAFDVLDTGSALNTILKSIDHTLHRALGNRAVAIALLHQSSSLRPLSSPVPTLIHSVELGLVLNPEQAFRLIDRGPAVDADAASVADFRDFWGEKAELRRFTDGAIVECVAWEVESPHERIYIPSRIVRHVLARHFSIQTVTEVQPSYDTFVLPHPSAPSKRFSSIEKGGGYKSAMQAFDGLVKRIKGMELPLSLVACLPCAEELRYTSVLAPSPIPVSRLASTPECARYTATYDAILQFEKSARWPDDLGAIQKVKLAWFETVAQNILAGNDGSKASIALDSFASPIEDGASLEVALPSGFAFRLRIYHDRERTLLERLIEDKTLPPFQKAEAERALSIHLQRFIHGPAHHSSISNIHHRHIGFSAAVRLIKRWFSSHLLSNFVSSELIELISAYIFLRPDPQVKPNIGSAGFARTMAFLADWDWRREPLLIPLHSMAGVDASVHVQFPTGKIEGVNTAFKERRAIDPGMSSGAWHIATEEEPTGVFWCIDGRGPTPMIADRIKTLAKASWTHISSEMEPGALSVKALFSHPLTDYDFIIHLHPNVLPRYSQNPFADDSVWSGKTKPINLQITTTGEEEILLDYDPAREFVNDLQRIYGDTVLFFYDKMGGTVIAGSWNPLVRQPKAFRALLGYSSRADGQKKGQVSLNVDAILGEIARMGQGLIKEIVKQSS
ncbi:hypothetical protein FRC18_011163 [Serendipita sp. 400]|nr:hypothetical protein FRC18_011163 [Serendipita sp. 400]